MSLLAPVLSLQIPHFCSHTRAQAGRRQSLQPKQVQLVLPGGSYTAADVTAFQAAAESADRSMLEVVWELAGRCQPVIHPRHSPTQ